ncbi:MAG: MMPL family transporter [Fibrobacteraceae bacterium]|nr:MMPL family transporter [Fibrobacteraceae bacterium]
MDTKLDKLSVMFTLLQRILKNALKHPWIVLGITLVVSLLAIAPVSKLRWELRILDTLPAESPVKETNNLVETKFGGFGTLTTIISSKDSALNDRLVKGLVKKLNGQRFISSVEYESELEFYKKNKLLYIRTSDLRKIQERILELQARYKLEANPLYVNLSEENKGSGSIAKAFEDSLSFEDLEAKYVSKLKDIYSNDSGTIRIINIYPTKKISDLDAARKLTHIVTGAFESLPESDLAELHYAGKVFETLSTGKTILPEAKKIGYVAAGILILLLFLKFARQPTLILVAAIPIAIALFWTMGAAGILYGRINLYTIILALILPGLSCQATTHIMARFADEQRKGLGSELSLESALLLVGPSIAVSAFVTAAAFIGLEFVPLAGIQELGVLGAIGALLNWFLCSLVLPSLIIIVQKYRVFRFRGKRIIRFSDFTARPFYGYKKLLIPIALISFILPIKGIYPEFDYDFSHMEYNPKTNVADSLLALTRFPHYDPAVAILPNAKAANIFYETMNQEIEDNPNTSIGSVTTYENLLPSNQEKKLALLKEIREELNPDFIKKLHPEDSAKIEKIIDSWNVTSLNVDDLPESIRHKFEGRDGTVGEFAFVFPNIDPDNGLACRRFAHELKAIRFPGGIQYPMTGTAIVRAEILDQTLPYLHKTILFGIAAIFFLLLLFYNKLSHALLTLASPILAFFWLLALLRLLGIELSAYSALAFPLLIGMSLDGSIQLWNAYYENSTGSLHFIISTTGITVFIAQLASLVGIFGLLFSSHPGIRSIGTVSMLGLLCISISHLLVFPLFAGWLDSRRFNSRKKRKAD